MIEKFGGIGYNFNVILLSDYPHKVGEAMECPRCKRPVNEGDYSCSRCGKRLKYPETLKNDLVFSSKDMPKPRKNIGKRIVIVLIAAIVICGVVLGTMLYMQRESGKDKPVKKAETTTVAAGTSGSTEATQKGSEAKQTTAPTSDEEKLYSYFRTANLYEDLLAEADGNMRVDLTAERNIAIAKYTILSSSSEEEQQDYFDSLDGFFDELSAKMDKAVYEMKNKSGVPNAELEIVAVDQNGETIYSNLID